MKIAKFIVLGALLGTMTNTEVVEAVQLHSLSHSNIEVAHKHKSHKKHKKAHKAKKHQNLAQEDDADADAKPAAKKTDADKEADETAATIKKDAVEATKEAAVAADKKTAKKAASKKPAGGEPKPVEKPKKTDAEPLPSKSDA